MRTTGKKANIIKNNHLTFGPRLPVEIQVFILKLAGRLTWYLNGMFNKDYLVKHGLEIWIEAFETDWDGDLALLPRRYLPTFKSGLTNLPDLADTGSVQSWIQKESLEDWDLSERYFKFHLDRCYLKPRLDRMQLMLLHIPLHHMWWDELPTWLRDDKVSTLIISAGGGHHRLFDIILTQLQDYPALSELLNICFYVAVVMGNADTVSKLINHHGIDPSSKRNTAMELASEYGHFQIAKLLLEDDRLAATEEAFAKAVEHKYFDIAKLLFDLNIDAWSTGDFRTDHPMKEAIENGEIETVKFLLPLTKPSMLFADLNPEEESDGSALDIAVFKDHIDIAKLLVNSFPEIDFENEAKYAVMWDSLKTLKFLIDHCSINPAFDDNELIRIAARKGSLDVAKFLLGRDDVDPTAQNNYALLEALLNGHKDIAKLLLERKDVDPTADGNKPIQYAAESGSVEMVKLLLGREGVDPTADNDKALRLAAADGSLRAVEKGHVEIVKLLTEVFFVNCDAGNGYPLRKAVDRGDVEMVKLLLQGLWGVNVNVLDGYALRKAVDRGDVEMVRLLVGNR
ncbi:hypothetical protein HDU76_001227 [Blyttiomyces sp. JEL0837]|nr:hypothetical protein HDU76_001227 [Blyttiomyces sp. JEL0837]